MRCPVCSSSSVVEWGVVGAFTILSCQECGLGVTHPFPTAEEREATNSEIYQVRHRIQAYLSRQDYFERRYRQYVATIRRFCQGGKLLDIGCNIGLFLKVAREKGFEVMGVELNRECAEFGASHFGLEIYAESLEHLQFPTARFDVVTLFDVLEHVPDPRTFLAEIRRILRPGGLLLVQSPNFASVMARVTGTTWHWLTPPDHLYHFTPCSLKRVMDDAGFGVVRETTWEPAGEFALNLLLPNKRKHLGLRILFGIERVTRMVTFLIALIQRYWWRRMQGGLLELYALNRDGA